MGSWSYPAINSPIGVGDYSSIAVDSIGWVHISYFDNMQSDLEYVTNSGGNWSYRMIDGNGDVGTGCMRWNTHDSPAGLRAPLEISSLVRAQLLASFEDGHGHVWWLDQPQRPHGERNPVERRVIVFEGDLSSIDPYVCGLGHLSPGS